MLSVAQELRGCDFGDKRLTKRAVSLGVSLSNHPEASINAACGSHDESKAAYRFFRNESVTPRSILESHTAKCIERMKICKSDVLLVQDTTNLDYTSFSSIEGLGNQQKKEGYLSATKGMMLHNSLAVTKDGVPLGLLKQSFFTYEDYREKRAQKKSSPKGTHKNTPIEKKKSFRWIEHFEETHELSKELSTRVIHVADRECDIFEFLQRVQSKRRCYVVRSAWNRKPREGARCRDTDTLAGKLSKSGVLGSIRVLKDSKSIECEIKVTSVSLHPPQRLPGAQTTPLDPLQVNVVEAKGECGKVKLNWRLLTNLDCRNLSDAIEVIDIYKNRWCVESFHRVLKSGFRVENARLGDRSRLEKFASLVSVVSWFIFFSYHLGRQFPELDAKHFFSREAIKVLRISAKRLKVSTGKTLSLKGAIFILARLGGFIGRKSDGEPGMKSIWRGWYSLQERMEFLEDQTCG